MSRKMKKIANKIQSKIYGAGHTTITKECNGNLCLDRTAFDNFLVESNIGDKPFSIISICGPARQGKSFMMNLILRYLEKEEWKQDNMARGEDGQLLMTAFKVASGDTCVTSGIVLYNHTIEVMWDGVPMVVILMDTQGIFDRKWSKRNEAFLLTLTTLMSSVQIFNVVHRVDTTRFYALENAINYGKLSAGEERCLKLQDLVLLVRDRKMSKQKCEMYRNQLFADDDSCAEENKVTNAKIRETFSHVSLFCLPRPGEEVEWPEEDKDEIKKDDIEDAFLLCVDEFLSETVSPLGRLKPKMTNGCSPIKIRDLYKLMIVCDIQFKNTSDDGRIDPNGIMDGEDKVAYESKYDELYKKFVNNIQHVDGKSEDEIRLRCLESSTDIAKQFRTAVSKWNVSGMGKQHATIYEDKLTEQMKKATERRVLKWLNQQETNTLMLELERKRLYEQYVASMKGCNTLRKLESEHEIVLSRIINTETENDMSELCRLVNAEYWKMKRNIMEREQDKKTVKELEQAMDQTKPAQFCTDDKAGIQGLREQMIGWTLEKQKNSLRDLWIELMNEKANTKSWSLLNFIRRRDPWREIKSLALDEQDMEDIDVLVQQKVLGSYWDCNLRDIEKSSIEQLNKKLWNDLKKNKQIRAPNNKLPLHLSGAPNDGTINVAHAQQLMGKVLGGVKNWTGMAEEKSQPGQVSKKTEYSRMVDDAVETFRKDFIWDISSEKNRSGEMNSHPTSVYCMEQIESVNIKFLNQICSALMDGYYKLEDILKKCKVDIASMRKNIREDTEKRLAVFMQHIVLTVREEFHKVMASRRYIPVVLETKFMQRLSDGYNSMYDDVIGLGNKTELKASVYERAKIKESLEAILEQNEENEGVIDNAVENIVVSESIFTKISAFFKSLFHRSN